MEHVSPELPPDRCPGLLRPHLAADGALVRLRAPGGRLPSGGLRRLSAASQTFADGDVHLTSRGNMQVRGVSLDECGNVPAGLVDAIAAAGFLPSPTHERVRNVVASPLSGLSDGFADIRPLIGALDTALCAEPVLADLPGRFLFGLDDGRGDVVGLRCDLAAVAHRASGATGDDDRASGATGDDDRASGATGNDSDRHTMRIVIGELGGPTVPVSQVVDTLIGLALEFAQIRGPLWHVRQLPEAGVELGGSGRAPALPPYSMPYGVLGGAVSALVPLGILSPSMAAALPDDDVIVTPWRGLVLPSGADPGALSDAGFVLSDDSAWPRVTACTGSPGCSLARGDTRALARRTAASDTTADRIHIVGCERACGAPNSPHTLVFSSRSTSHRSST